MITVKPDLIFGPRFDTSETMGRIYAGSEEAAPTPWIIPGSPLERLGTSVGDLATGFTSAIDPIMNARRLGLNVPEYYSPLFDPSAFAGATRLGGIGREEVPISQSYTAPAPETQASLADIVKKGKAEAKPGHLGSYWIGPGGAMGTGSLPEKFANLPRTPAEGKSGLSVVESYIEMHKKLSPENIQKAMKKLGLADEALPTMLQFADKEKAGLPSLPLLHSIKMMLESSEVKNIMGGKKEDEKKAEAYRKFQPLYTQYIGLQKALANAQKGVNSLGLKLPQPEKEQAVRTIQTQIESLKTGLMADPSLAELSQLYLGGSVPAGTTGEATLTYNPETGMLE